MYPDPTALISSLSFQSHGFPQEKFNVLLIIIQINESGKAFYRRTLSNFQKQPYSSVPSKRYSENMQQIYCRTLMPRCDFNKAAMQLYWNRTSARVCSCKFAAYFQINLLHIFRTTFLNIPLDGCFWTLTNTLENTCEGIYFLVKLIEQNSFHIHRKFSRDLSKIYITLFKSRFREHHFHI